MDRENSPNLHDEQEIASLRLDIAGEFVLLVYGNLAEHWWWDGLEIKARVGPETGTEGRYVLHQTDDSPEYDPFKYPLKPQKLGHVEITPVTAEAPKPVDVVLVCSWPTVISFWKELEIVLRREYPVIATGTGAEDELSPDRPSDSANAVHVPKSPARLRKWKLVYRKIRGWWPELSYKEIGARLKKDPTMRGLPKAPDTIAMILRAGNAGELDED